MKIQEDILEQNVQRLVQAAIPPAARPDSHIARSTLESLRRELHSLHPVPAFPALVLGLLVAMLALLGLQIIASAINFGNSHAPSPLLSFVCAALATNLVFLPVASATVVIFLRKKRG